MVQDGGNVRDNSFEIVAGKKNICKIVMEHKRLSLDLQVVYDNNPQEVSQKQVRVNGQDLSQGKSDIAEKLGREVLHQVLDRQRMTVGLDRCITAKYGCGPNPDADTSLVWTETKARVVGVLEPQDIKTIGTGEDKEAILELEDVKELPNDSTIEVKMVYKATTLEAVSYTHLTLPTKA